MDEQDLLLGSFIFLRFLSPAIIFPDTYDILPRDRVSVAARRNLKAVLISIVFEKTQKIIILICLSWMNFQFFFFLGVMIMK